MKNSPTFVKAIKQIVKKNCKSFKGNFKTDEERANEKREEYKK
jgi:hypothetical protein